MLKLLLMIGITGASAAAVMPDLTKQTACMAHAALDSGTAVDGFAASCPRADIGRSAELALRRARQFVGNAA